MTFPILGGNGAVAGYSIDNSLKFNVADSTKLTRTQTAGNRKTFTFSGWIKRSRLADRQAIFSASPDGSNESFLWIDSDDKLFAKENGEATFELKTNRVFRDTSAWYHIVFAVDTTQGTAGDRIRIYVNGVEETSFGTETQPSQNDDTRFNNNSQDITIGFHLSSYPEYFGGYLAEINWIDGQQLTPSSFGEFDEDSGIWKPKKYTGTYGNNGFYLKFANSGSLGADSSGNGNNFTPSNLASTDQTTDTPTNNFATLTIMYNPINTTGGTSFSEGNLKFTSGTGSARDMDKTAISNIPVNSGKWYCEVKLGSEGQERIGAGPHQGMIINGGNNNRYAYIENDGDRLVQDGTGEVNTAYMANPSNGDIMMLALDMDNKRLYAGTNGLWSNGSGSTNQSSPSAFLDLSSGTMLTNDTDLSGFAVFQFTSHDASTNQSYEVNFGNPTFSISSGNTDDNGYGNFEYAPPTGYLSLCTQNLATELSPTIDDGSAYFHTRLYSGTGSALSITNNANAGNFKPDWIWLKSRNNATNHNVFDSSRGQTKRLYPNLNDVEDTVSGFTLDTNGFSTGTSSVGDINVSGKTYVAWQWKCNNGTTSSNSSGSITSTVQVNATAGFSIVQYGGNDTAGATVGHGLGKIPKMIFVKNRSFNDSWIVYHEAINNTHYLLLDATGAADNYFAAWNNTSPTSSVFSLHSDSGGRWVNNTGDNYIAYCFAEIEGYSKFGSYTGNGSTDGTFVYTGFRPAFVIFKRTDSAEWWGMIDATRDTFNAGDKFLKANDSVVEGTGLNFDLLSNGFKARHADSAFNGSGGTYIYMAFAENPFVDSNAIPVTAR